MGCEARYDCMSAELFWGSYWEAGVYETSHCYLKGVFNTQMCEEFGGTTGNQRSDANWYFYQRGISFTIEKKHIWLYLNFSLLIL